ncbi:hypothetical protein [Fischerella sp. JS2]|uniref:hypothetical protein n=1 Tax=Fischerella sp. JS2 TaxID=2597771 RepID=UPI0028EC4C60|nr:hypothetical protein [Fischerella sp. JS2]
MIRIFTTTLVTLVLLGTDVSLAWSKIKSNATIALNSVTHIDEKLSQAVGQNITCEGQLNIADISWQQGQPLINFESKPPGKKHLNNAPATRVSNKDGSISYISGGKTTTTVTFFSNGKCSLLVKSTSGSVTVEEKGQKVTTGQSDITCDGQRHTAYIQWQKGQPYMTFESRPPSTGNLHNSPATRVSNIDGSVSYQSKGETITTVRFFSDGRCTLKLVNSRGSGIQETGQILAKTQPNHSEANEETLLAFQTDTQTVRVFRRNGQLLMDLYNKQNPSLSVYNIPTQMAPKRGAGDNWTSYLGKGNFDYYARFNSNGATEIELRTQDTVMKREDGYSATGIAYSSTQ